MWNSVLFSITQCIHSFQSFSAEYTDQCWALWSALNRSEWAIAEPLSSQFGWGRMKANTDQCWSEHVGERQDLTWTDNQVMRGLLEVIQKVYVLLSFLFLFSITFPFVSCNLTVLETGASTLSHSVRHLNHQHQHQQLWHQHSLTEWPNARGSSQRALLICSMMKTCHSLKVLDSLHRYSLSLQYFGSTLLYSSMNSFLFVVNSSTFVRKAPCKARVMASHIIYCINLEYCGISTDCSVTRHIGLWTEQIWRLSRVTWKVE